MLVPLHPLHRLQQPPPDGSALDWPQLSHRRDSAGIVVTAWDGALRIHGSELYGREVAVAVMCMEAAGSDAYEREVPVICMDAAGSDLYGSSGSDLYGGVAHLRRL